MRAILLFGTVILASMVSQAAAQTAVRWQPTLEAGKQAAAGTNRLILLHFWAPSCGACLRMENEVFSRADVAGALDANYVGVRLNADHFPNVARDYGVTALPTDVVLTAQGALVHKVVGFRPATDYVAAMNLIANHVKAQAQRLAMANPPAGPAAPTGAMQGPSAYGAPSPGFGANPPASASPGGPAPNNSLSGGPAPNTSLAGGPAPSGNPPFAQGNLPGGYSDSSREGPVTAPYSPPLASTAPRDDTRSSAAGSAGSPAGPSASGSTPSLPPGMPPLGLDGYCPVSLREKGKWVWGDRRWGAFHEGRTYLFVGPQEQERFLKNPLPYAPVMAGVDLVLMVESGQMVPGHRRFGAWYDDRVYLFSNEASYQKFNADAARYANAQTARSGANLR